MTDYVMRLSSSYSHSPEIVDSLLRIPALSEVIFPAVLHTDVDKSLLLNSSEQFNFSLIPPAYFSEYGYRLPLHGLNGIKLYSSIHTKPTVTPDVLGLEFKSEHIEQGIVNLSILKDIFEEIIPIFQVDTGTVYDESVLFRANSPYRPQEDASKSKRYFEDSRGKRCLLEVQWINYFGEHVLDSLGHERFATLHTYSEKYEFHKGIMLILQDEPYDDNNQEHQQRQIQAEAELFFEEGTSDEKGV